MVALDKSELVTVAQVPTAPDERERMNWFVQVVVVMLRSALTTAPKEGLPAAAPCRTVVVVPSLAKSEEFNTRERVPPRDTLVPLIVIAELARAALGTAS
jgi:hypothetical protein